MIIYQIRKILNHKPRSGFVRNLACRLLSATIATEICAAQNADTPEQFVLHYDKPAKQWMTEALPVGNGRVGAMLFGGVEKERIQFNEESLWTGRPFPAAPENPPAKWDEVHEFLRQGKFAEANRIGLAMHATPYGTKSYKEYQKAFGSYQAFGDLMLDIRHPAGSVTNYHRSLDISRAISNVTYQINGVTFRREIFASFPTQVIVMRLSADRPGQISLRASFTTPHKNSTTTGKNGRMALSGKLADNGMAFEAQLSARTRGGTVHATEAGIEITAADEVELLLDAATDYQNAAYAHHTGEAPASVCQRHLDAALKKPYDTLRSEHLIDYQALYQRCALELGGPDRSAIPTDQRLADFKAKPDPALEALVFQFGRYLLISSSRPGTMPANLQGIWNDSTNPPWTCDWHFDINVEMNYWPAEVTGLSECHQPLFDLMQTLQKPGAEAARRAFNARGWFAAINSNPWGYSDNRWHSRGIAGWLCQHLWEHYLYTGDREFLRNTAWPMMKNASLFLLDSLIEVDGVLVTGTAESPENKFKAPDGKLYSLDFGIAMDTQVAWELFGNCAEAAAILDTDAVLARQLTAARARLAKPKIGRFGQLQEWYRDFDRTEDKHRHTSHLWAVFPGRQITPRDTPEFAKAAAISLQYRGSAANGWAFPWRSLIYSRLHHPELAYTWLKGAMQHTTQTRMIYDVGGGMYPNLFGACPPFQIDSNFGTTAAVAEMLLQSHMRTDDGSPVIHLLPALPPVWQEGRTKGLRARGGFVLDLAWKDGKLTAVSVTPNRAGKAVLKFGDKSIPIEGTPGKTLRFDGSLAPQAK